MGRGFNYPKAVGVVLLVAFLPISIATTTTLLLLEEIGRRKKEKIGYKNK